MRWGTTTALLGIASVVALATAAPAAAQPPSGAGWTADLTDGEAAGVALDGGAVRLDPDSTFLAAADGDASDRPLPTGLLTFPPHPLDAPTDRIAAVLTADVPAGGTVTVDVRGRRDGGGWTEWIPAGSTPDGPTVTLPARTSEVQGRLVLAGDGGPSPVVHAVELSALPASPGSDQGEDGAEQAPLSYRVFATREGLVGATTANGHVIGERDHFVALPSRRALAPRDTSDYSVRVCAPTGRCAFAPVWDVGPWNTRDDYWNPGSVRQEWGDLAQGLPQAQAAHDDGYNDGKDQFDREVANPAGIDLGDGLFWDALELEDNAWVTVDYLWTGSARLAKVDVDEQILAAPDDAAAVVGIAAASAAVPVECVLESGTQQWLRIGADQYLAAGAVSDAGPLASCAPSPRG